MAYNKKNRLQKIVDIQNIYLAHRAKGESGEHIYQRVIYPIYRISKATFSNYLGINAKKELKELCK